MNKKIARFGIWLTTLVAIFIVGRIYLSSAHINEEYLNIIRTCLNLLYPITPLFAVLLTDRKSIRNLLTLKTMSYGNLFKIIFITAILFPLIILGLTFLSGNILNLDLFGEIITQGSNSTTFLGMLLPQGLFFNILAIFLYSLLVGLTFNLLLALGGEIAWRGFLEKEFVAKSRAKKTMMIGLIWGIWFALPIIVLRSLDHSFDTVLLFEIALILVFHIVCSFLCVKALYKSGTIIGPAAVVGIINSLPCFYLITDMTPKSYFIGGGNHGIFAIIAVIFINILIGSRSRNRPAPFEKQIT